MTANGNLDDGQFTLYILRTSAGTLYIGQTNNLDKRLREHRSKSQRAARYVRNFDSFELVYAEHHPTRRAVMQREHELKKWTRQKKLELIAMNPTSVGKSAINNRSEP